jgi:hypothetical protein
VTALRLFFVQRDESLLKVDLVPGPRQQLAQPNAGEIVRYKERFQVVRQIVPQGAVIVRKKSLPALFSCTIGK